MSRAHDLPALTIRHDGDELDFDELRATALIDAACAQIGVDAHGSLIERATACLSELKRQGRQR